jgi:hypothetical protein
MRCKRGCERYVSKISVAFAFSQYYDPQDSYRIDQDALEPDLFIVDLNSELAGCDDCTALTLQDRERR